MAKRILKKSVRPRKAASRKMAAFAFGAIGAMSPCPTCGTQLRIIDHATK